MVHNGQNIEGVSKITNFLKQHVSRHVAAKKKEQNKTGKEELQDYWENTMNVKVINGKIEDEEDSDEDDENLDGDSDVDIIHADSD